MARASYSRPFDARWVTSLKSINESISRKPWKDKSVDISTTPQMWTKPNAARNKIIQYRMVHMQCVTSSYLRSEAANLFRGWEVLCWQGVWTTTIRYINSTATFDKDLRCHYSLPSDEDAINLENGTLARGRKRSKGSIDTKKLELTMTCIDVPYN